MERITQKTFDKILEKIRDNYDSVSLREYKQLVEFISGRYTGYDIILGTLSNKELRHNYDYFGRSYFESVYYKNLWGSGSKHQILSCIYKASYGLTSKSRKSIFLKNQMFFEEDNVGFGNRSGFAYFKFFIRGFTPYLFFIHEYGYNSITNKIEELVSKIEEEYLHDIGFDIIADKVQIYYKDTGSDYNQVTLKPGLQNPVWRSLELNEQQWFDQTWDVVGSLFLH